MQAKKIRDTALDGCIESIRHYQHLIFTLGRAIPLFEKRTASVNLKKADRCHTKFPCTVLFQRWELCRNLVLRLVRDLLILQGVLGLAQGNIPDVF